MSLESLLDGVAGFGPEYGDGLSSHLPMALVALQRLGADDARLTAWHDTYAVRLPPAPATQPWPAGDAWPPRLGEFEAWPAYRSLFAEWISYEGAAEVLAQVLPQLMPGCSGVAFHGAIRVAYAVRSGHRAELADALAYWACRHQRLGPLSAAPGTETDPEPVLRRLRAGRSGKGLIALRMLDAAQDKALHAQIARLAIDTRTLERLARLSAKAYALSGNFTALHLLTACHAMRVLAVFIDDGNEALRWFWQAWATGVVAARLVQVPAAPLQTWKRIVHTALAADDEHVIKLVDSCRELERAYGGDDWQRAASRVVT